MSGTDQPEHGFNERGTSFMFEEELTELVRFYLSKVDDPDRVIAVLGNEFVSALESKGVSLEDTLDLILDELRFRKEELSNNNKPVLKLIKDT